MAFEGEFNDSIEGHQCADCGAKFPVEVQRSNAGFYIGTFCPNCGPYDRKSGYFPSREAAEAELSMWLSADVRPSARDTEFHPGELTVIELGEEV